MLLGLENVILDLRSEDWGCLRSAFNYQNNFPVKQVALLSKAVPGSMHKSYSDADSQAMKGTMSKQRTLREHIAFL